MSHTVAVVIDGTYIRVAVCGPDSPTPIAHQRIRSLATEAGVFNGLTQTIDAVWPKEAVGAIDIGSPGPLEPSILICGSGVSRVGDLLFEPFEASLRKHSFHLHDLDDLVIKKAALGDEAGLLGALALARVKTA